MSTKTTLILCLFIAICSKAQTLNFKFETVWEEEKYSCTPCAWDMEEGIAFSSATKRIKLNGGYDFSHEVTNVVYTPVDLPSFYDKAYLPDTPGLKVSFGHSGGDNYVTVFYAPIVNKNGIVSIVSEIGLSVSGIPEPNTYNRDVEFATTSVLSSGDWYKIGVESEGVFKLEYDDLASLGIPVGSINPKSINIYGNQIPEISHNNSIYRPDDLVKNSIYISGEEDLSFDSGDYILFYAKGPENLMMGGGSFNPRKNRIDSLAYYFIRVDNSIPPKRIGIVNSSGESVTHTVTNYSAYALHENNNTNLIKSGDGWYGEYFEGSNLTKSFIVNAENREVSEPVFLKSHYVSASKSGTSYLRITINGANVDTITSATLTGKYSVATSQSSETSFSSGSENFEVTVTFHRTSPSAEAWLDYLQFNYIKKLRMGVQSLVIRDFRVVGSGNVASYSIGNATAGTTVWEVTDPYDVDRVNGVFSGSGYSFSMNADSLRTFVAFNLSQTKSPVLSGQYLGKIPNQNLHALPQVDYLIVTHELLRAQADRLAELHRANGLTVHVVDIQKIYNEFGGGAADPVAVRWFSKMFYDRSEIDPANRLRYLCLFGDGSYDPLNRILNNNYLLPTYNSPEIGTVSYTTSFTSDDFFGLLDDDEAMTEWDMLDVGVGRIPVSELEEAEDVVNKIEHYMNNGSALYTNVSGVQCNSDGYASTFGDWRNRIVLMSDDIDDVGADIGFVDDCEDASDITVENHPEINIVKIYLDAYKQVVTSGGERYPDAVEAINQNINKGALVFNYVGHGGETGLSLERVVSIPMIQEWSNINNLPVFVSATCEFSRFDDPGRISAGETTLTTPHGGAIGLLTTTRAVSIGINALLVRNLYTELFNEEDGEPLTLGEIIRRTKNLTLGDDHMRHFGLLGDPALMISKPGPRIVTDEINGVAVGSGTDTLMALSKITIKGHVENESGAPLPTYNGIVYSTVFDKTKDKQTLGQNSESIVKDFYDQSNIIYRGKSTVKNGEFTFSFVVPKDIDYSFGKGKVSYYGNNNDYDNYGYDTSIVVGGVNPDGISDDIGPEIELYMNDENFVNGGLTDTKPLFMANIRDENGINTTGNGIGHNITLIIDGNTSSPIILNNFYEADLDTYQSGKVSYRLSDLEVGPHQLVFKVWDVNNNSSEATLDFIVMEEEEIGISHLLNYPNPFTTNTDFYFEHNQVCNSMDVKVEIFTVSGKLVKTIIKTVHSSGFRSEGINWDGRDDYGDKLGRGVYVYRLSIETGQGKKAEKIEKLVIL